MMDPMLTEFLGGFYYYYFSLSPFPPHFDLKEALVYGLQDCGTAYDFID